MLAHRARSGTLAGPAHASYRGRSPSPYSTRAGLLSAAPKFSAPAVSPPPKIEIEKPTRTVRLSKVRHDELRSQIVSNITFGLALSRNQQASIITTATTAYAVVTTYHTEGSFEGNIAAVNVILEVPLFNNGDLLGAMDMEDALTTILRKSEVMVEKFRAELHAKEALQDDDGTASDYDMDNDTDMEQSVVESEEEKKIKMKDSKKNKKKKKVETSVSRKENDDKVTVVMPGIADMD